MMKHDVLRTYDYHLWANEKVFERLQEVPQEICEQEVPSVFPTISKTLNHMLLTDYVWLLAMQGESYEKVGKVVGQLSSETAGKSVTELREMFHELAGKFKDFFQQVDLEATAPYSHPQMGTILARYCDIVQHVVNHGTYHRGNISAMLRQLGHAGASSDYIYYLFEVLPKEK